MLGITSKKYKVSNSLPTPPNPAGPFLPKGTRQPLLWAALAYAAGTVLAEHLYRPPGMCMAAIVIFVAAASFWNRKKPRCAWVFILMALAVLPILLADFRSGRVEGSQFADGAEFVISGHVVAAGEVTPTSRGGLQQRVDVAAGGLIENEVSLEATSAFRVNVFDPTVNPAVDSSVDSKEEALANAGETDRRIKFPELHYGDRVRFPARLHLPHNYRNPGAFDYLAYLRSQGITATVSVRSDRVERLPGFTGNRWELLRTRVHRGIIATIHRLWPPEQAALIDAMVIGDDAFLNRETRADFQRSGTYHVLVVSGMNVSILAFVCFWVLRRLRAGEVPASILTVVMSVLYAIVTDVGAPVWRAVLMMAVYLGARLLYRERSMLNALGAAALALMLLDPSAVLGASFQLTFLCVLAIAAAGVPLLERTSAPYRTGLRHLDSLEYDPTLPPRVAQMRVELRMLRDRLRQLPGASVSARALMSCVGAALGAFDLVVISALMQVSLALPMAYYFHRATSFGIPANLLVVPFTEILMPAAVAAVALGSVAMGSVSRTLAWIPARITSLALAAITGTVRGLGGLRLADLRVATPQSWVILATAVCLAAAMLLARRRWHWTGLGLAGLLASALWIGWGPARPQVRAGVLEVTAIDVGEGDSNLIVTPEGKTLLIDAGGPTGGPHLSEFDVGENVVSSYLWARGFQRLDVVALTHAHSDHMGGMRSVLRNFHPKELWLSVIPPSEDLAKLLQDAREQGIAVHQHFAGDEFPWGGAQFRVLAPERDWRSFRPGNNDSLVLQITYGASAALLEGDAEASSEARMSAETPAAMLLKVAHHGSKTSATPGFLSAVHPRYAMISVGAGNPFGLPKREVLDRLEQARIQTHRTDMEGAVTFLLEGRDVHPWDTHSNGSL